jgi:redox-sensitive bicupin YhaK (pirin superfamily)
VTIPEENGIIRSGEVQIMSAGSGIAHSESNASKVEDVNFLRYGCSQRKGI